MTYNIGDEVYYRDNKQLRRIREIKGDTVLLWGFYEYVNVKDLRVENEQDN